MSLQHRAFVHRHDDALNIKTIGPLSTFFSNPCDKRRMSDRYYQWAKSHYDDDGGVTLGEFRLGWNVLYWAFSALGLFILYVLIRLMLGLTAWVGFVEVDVRRAPQWMQTSASNNTQRENFGLPMKIVAFAGQQIVIRYDLKGEKLPQGAALTPARIMVSCLCPATRYRHFSIEHAGAGEFIMPVTHNDFYTVSITQQYAQTDGKPSIGHYRWGVRQAQ